jgi:hypothetical protein
MASARFTTSAVMSTRIRGTEHLAKDMDRPASFTLDKRGYRVKIARFNGRDSPRSYSSKAEAVSLPALALPR